MDNQMTKRGRMNIVAIKEKSEGNETVGNSWLETKIFDEDTPVSEIIKWSQDGSMKPAYGGKLIITVPDNTEV